MINIIDCEEYEKNKNFYVELGEPRVSNRETEYYDIVSFEFPYPFTSYELELRTDCHFTTVLEREFMVK